MVTIWVSTALNHFATRHDPLLGHLERSEASILVVSGAVILAATSDLSDETSEFCAKVFALGDMLPCTEILSYLDMMGTII